MESNNILNKQMEWTFAESSDDIDVLIFTNDGTILPIFISLDSTYAEHFRNKEKRMKEAAFICKAVNNYDSLLEALKDCYRYLEVSYADDDLSNQGKAARLKVIDAILQCNGEDEIEKKLEAKEISDNILNTINVITDQYRKDHNIKPI